MFVQPHCKNLKTVCTFLIMLQSSKSGVFPVAGAVKFEMCMVICFLHAEGQLADLKSHFLVFFPFKSTSEVSKLKMQFCPTHTQRGEHFISNFQCV